MTVTPSWYSQRFRPDGGLTANGLRNQLGRPSLSRMTVLVREAAQNSWDAKICDRVHFRIELGWIRPEHRPNWEVLHSAGGEGLPEEGFPLGDFLDRPRIDYLAISDRGTEGLDGPTRSDVPAPPGRRNWLSFVLNSGDKQDTVGGGGTYGYGKGAFYVMSRVGTVLIHSRFRDDDGGLTTRLIGAALGSSFTYDGVPYTGRHWWGMAGEDLCEPLEDAHAVEAAEALGLPRFDGDATGTTVVVLAPDLSDPTKDLDDPEDLSHAEAARFLADTAGWNLWPLMLPDRPQQMTVTVSGDDVPISVPGPDNDPVIKSFAEAYRKAVGAEAEKVTYGNAKTSLGRLAHTVTLGALTDSPAAKELGVQGAPHHFALMRHPDLIVRYFEGPAKQHPSVGYAGVLKVDDELDAVFAASEPPTHDSWNATQLQGRDASYVRVTHRRLADVCRRLAGLAGGTPAVASVSASSLSRRLGHLIAVAAEARPGGGDGGSGGSGGEAGRRRRPKVLGTPVYDSHADRTVLRQRVALPAEGTFTAACHVITGDGSAENSAPVGASSPTVIGWLGKDGGLVPGPALTVQQEQVVDLLVQPVGDAVVEITVKAHP